MLVGAIARIDDAGVKKAREKMGRARGAVANDDDIRVERLEIACGVLEGFTLF